MATEALPAYPRRVVMLAGLALLVMVTTVVVTVVAAFAR